MSLSVYGLAFVVNPVYADMLQQGASQSAAHGAANTSNDADSKIKQLSSAQLDKMLKEANGGSAFQSQAGNASMPVTASINPGTLQLDFPLNWRKFVVDPCRS